jgi:hypothetical protein
MWGKLVAPLRPGEPLFSEMKDQQSSVVADNSLGFVAQSPKPIVPGWI